MKKRRHHALRLALLALGSAPLLHAPSPVAADPPRVTARPAPSSERNDRRPPRRPRRCPVPVPPGLPCPRTPASPGRAGVHIEGHLNVHVPSPPSVRIEGRGRIAGRGRIEGRGRGEADTSGRTEAGADERNGTPGTQPPPLRARRWEPYDLDAKVFVGLRPCREAERFGQITSPVPRCRPNWFASGLPWQLRLEVPGGLGYVWGPSLRVDGFAAHFALGADLWLSDSLGFGLDARVVVTADGWRDVNGDGEDDDTSDLAVWLLGGGLRWRLWTDAIVREGWTLRFDAHYGAPTGDYGLRPGLVLSGTLERHFGELDIDGWSWEFAFGARYLHGLMGLQGWQAALLNTSVRFGWNAREPDEFDGDPPRPEGLPHFVGTLLTLPTPSGGLRAGFPWADGWLEGRLQLEHGQQKWRPQLDVDESFFGRAWRLLGGLRLNVPILFFSPSARSLIAFHLELLAGGSVSTGDPPGGGRLFAPIAQAQAGFALVFSNVRLDVLAGGLRASLEPEPHLPRWTPYVFLPVLSVEFGDFEHHVHTRARRAHRLARRREGAARRRCWQRWERTRTLSPRCEGLIGDEVRFLLAARRRGSTRAQGPSMTSSGDAQGRPSVPGARIEAGIRIGGSTPSPRRAGHAPPLPPTHPPTEFHIGVFAHGTVQGLAWGALPWERIATGGARLEFHLPPAATALVHAALRAEAQRRGIALRPEQLTWRAAPGIQIKVFVWPR